MSGRRPKGQAVKLKWCPGTRCTVPTGPEIWLREKVLSSIEIGAAPRVAEEALTAVGVNSDAMRAEGTFFHS